MKIEVVEVVLYDCPVMTKFVANLINLKLKIRYIGDVFDDDIISSDYENLSLYEDVATGEIYSTVL